MWTAKVHLILLRVCSGQVRSPRGVIFHRCRPFGSWSFTGRLCAWNLDGQEDRATPSFGGEPMRGEHVAAYSVSCRPLLLSLKYDPRPTDRWRRRRPLGRGARPLPSALRSRPEQRCRQKDLRAAWVLASHFWPHGLSLLCFLRVFIVRSLEFGFLRFWTDQYFFPVSLLRSYFVKRNHTWCSLCSLLFFFFF